jgi:hypothetical protein
MMMERHVDMEEWRIGKLEDEPLFQPSSPPKNNLLLSGIRVLQ